ncbi:MAG TPA: hypothetical protein V6C72_08500, partial [Chroococcales cyanobacterium]
MNTQKDRTPSKRLNKKALLFKILTNEPELTAAQLQVRARDLNINLSLLAAYRALRAFRESGGSLENSESRCLRVVAAVLQNCAEGEHLTAAQILARAEEQNLSVHLATIYRVLAR